jgi:hypothetical protein
MKKWLAGFALLIILLIGSAYIFIPGNLAVSSVVLVNSSSESVFRSMSDENTWRKWWPGPSDSSLGNSRLSCGPYSFSLSKKGYNSFDINAANKDGNADTRLLLIQVVPDTLAIQWQTSIKTSNNPVKRVRQYQQGVHLKKCMDDILVNLQTFLNQTSNIYGFDIKRTTLTDSVLVTTKTTTRQYPATEIIYSMVQELNKYITAQGAEATNYPMLNISRNADSTYAVMVAIATNRELAGNEKIFTKRFSQIPDKTLFTEVKGGTENIDKAFNAISLFMADNHLTAPVIPFQLLVTDRSKEKDPSKWITRIYYPIV